MNIPDWIYVLLVEKISYFSDYLFLLSLLNY